MHTRVNVVIEVTFKTVLIYSTRQNISLPATAPAA